MLPLERRGLSASQLVYGCMGLGGDDWSNRTAYTAHDVNDAQEAVEAALSIGINMFDHANIYKAGKAEQVFGEVLKQRKDLREQIILQSKCGIRFPDDQVPFTRFDFSKKHILDSVDGILARLGVDYLDILLLHRPDALVEPDDVAAAFAQLQTTGKVRWFGVSNMSAGQIRLLKLCVEVPLVVNQLEMSLYRHGWVEVGVNVNQDPAASDIFPEGTIEYCRMENIQIQAWGPLARGLYSGASLDGLSETVKKTADKVRQFAQSKETTPEAIILAWLMRHPAHIQPVIGTKNPDRIRACKDAGEIVLTREEWYELWITARGANMP